MEVEGAGEAASVEAIVEMVNNWGSGRRSSSFGWILGLVGVVVAIVRGVDELALY